MDFDLRDWLLILGPIFISIVLIHGYWRMHWGRTELKMKLDKSFLSHPGDEQNGDDLDLFRAELPNGGARIAGEQVPVLMESVETSSPNIKPVAGISRKAEPELQEPELPEPEITEPAIAATREAQSTRVEPLPERAPPVRKPLLEKPEKFVVINVLSDVSFAGWDLREVLEGLDMEFGEMDIFHRLGEDGEVQFSLVNAVEPGTFDQSTMNEIQTPGVTLFMRAHEVQDPIRVYDDLLEAAQTIALELGGELKDETRSAITSQTISHCRQGIQDFQYKYSA
ncbi:MAG: cell division protein ZipA [Gammaproteobacteria bacterium]|nr:cell division protein ZipA [Gammaproteobacteria bacterium]